MTSPLTPQDPQSNCGAPRMSIGCTTSPGRIPKSCPLLGAQLVMNRTGAPISALSQHRQMRVYAIFRWRPWAKLMPSKPPNERPEALGLHVSGFRDEIEDWPLGILGKGH
jgi:hypothetical protein